MTSFNQPSDDPVVTDVIIGSHSVGNLGHGGIEFFRRNKSQRIDFAAIRLGHGVDPAEVDMTQLVLGARTPEIGLVAKPVNVLERRAGIQFVLQSAPGCDFERLSAARVAATAV